MTVLKLLAAAIAISVLPLAADAQDVSFGSRLFHDKADCAFCHGINGDGRGDPRSPGQAADLHKTIGFSQTRHGFFGDRPDPKRLDQVLSFYGLDKLVQ